MSGESKIFESDLNNVKIREFIYLDRPRLISYAAQLNNGLMNARQLTEATLVGQAITSPTKKSETETTDKATGAAGIKFGVDLSGGAEFNYTRRKGVEEGGDLTFDFSGMQFSRDMRDHDNLFESVEKKLLEKGILTEYTGGFPLTPLIQINGLLKLTDWSAMMSFLENIQSFRELGTDIGDQKTVKSMQAMARILKSMSLPEIIANFSANHHSISAPLDLKHLNMPIEQLRTSYAMHNALNATLIAISPTETNEVFVPRGPLSQLSLDGILASLFGKSDLTVFPIAIYLNL